MMDVVVPFWNVLLTPLNRSFNKQGLCTKVFCLFNDVLLSQPFPYFLLHKKVKAQKPQPLPIPSFSNLGKGDLEELHFSFCNDTFSLLALSFYWAFFFKQSCLHFCNTIGTSKVDILLGSGIDGCHENHVKSQKVDYLILHYLVSETGSPIREQTTH